MKTLFFISIIFISYFFFTLQSEAVRIIIDSPKTTIDRGEEFYIDLLLDTEGKSFNGIEGNISFIGGDLSFIRALNVKSIMDLWIENPIIKKYSINFSAISTYGFSGVIDPFNQDDKLPGLITRLFFKPSISGQVLFTTSNFFVTQSDGSGTMVEIPPISFSVSVNEKEYIPEANEEVRISEPEIKAYIVQDINLYNNKYVLIFQAKDNNFEIDKVLVKEGKRKWKEIESPYLLKDQNRSSLINIWAISYSGQSVSITIDPLPDTSKIKSDNIYILILFFVFLLFIFIKRIYFYKK
jgi:hypothetical protein